MMVCAFDLECHSSTGGFPNPTVRDDRIEIIGLVFSDGTRVALVLDDDLAPLEDGTIVETFGRDETALILAFRRWVLRKKCTILLAHNGYGFDLPYLIRRMDLLGGGREYLRLSPFHDRHATVRHTTLRHQDSAYDASLLRIFGVAVLDTLVYFRRMFSLGAYSLDALGEHFLREKKHDVSPGFMFKVFGGKVDDHAGALATVVRYCLQDCALCLRLVEHTKMILALLALARVTLTPVHDYLTTGQQVKSYNCVAKKAYDMGYYINKDHLPEPEGSYQGATVLEATIGFNEHPVACLDFASLYPSIMSAYNLCYSTIEIVRRDGRTVVERSRALTDADRDIYEGVGGLTISYVKKHVRRGVVPAVVEDLMAERKAVKKRMKAASGAERDILDKLQWAVKIVQNSIYGFMGVQGKKDETGKWIFRPTLANAFVAQTITLNGRRLIDRTCAIVKEIVPTSEIVYGDSIAPWTPLLLRHSDSYRVFVDTVEGLSQRGLSQRGRGGHWVRRPDGKDVMDMEGIETWTEQGWTAVRRIICHEYDGHLVRVSTPQGTVDVTRDHSLVSSEGRRVHTSEVSVGTSLLHAWPPHAYGVDRSVDPEVPVQVLESPIPYDGGRVSEAILNGGYQTHQRFAASLRHYALCNDDAAALEVYYILRAQGYPVHHFRFAGGVHLSFSRSAVPPTSDRVRSMTTLPHQGLVYDLETENHHFQAGIGPLIVHNTDSAMVKFTHLPPTIAGLRQAMVLGEKVAAEVTTHFPPPVLLEYEKTYWPFVQKAKKRYATCAYESMDITEGHRDAKGLEICRRDNAPLLRDLYDAVLRSLTPTAMELPGEGDDRGFDFQTIMEGVRTAIWTHLEAIVDDALPMEKYIVTKQLRSEYKGWVFDQESYQYVMEDPMMAAPMPPGHVLLANRINARIDQGLSQERPSPGDRIPFIVVMGEPKTPLRDRLEDPKYDNIPPLDRYYYMEKAKDAIEGICQGIVEVSDLFDQGLRSVPRYHDPRQRNLRDLFGVQAKRTAPSLKPVKKRPRTTQPTLRTYFQGAASALPSGS
jgi:DNA polymerase elongation subunit (family B)